MFWTLRCSPASGEAAPGKIKAKEVPPAPFPGHWPHSAAQDSALTLQTQPRTCWNCWDIADLWPLGSLPSDNNNNDDGNEAWNIVFLPLKSFSEGIFPAVGCVRGIDCCIALYYFEDSNDVTRLQGFCPGIFIYCQNRWIQVQILHWKQAVGFFSTPRVLSGTETSQNEGLGSQGIGNGRSRQEFSGASALQRFPGAGLCASHPGRTLGISEELSLSLGKFHLWELWPQSESPWAWQESRQGWEIPLSETLILEKLGF